MKEIISYKDIECERDKIIVDAFNSFYNQGFLIRGLKLISQGTGYGDEYTNFVFWNDLDDYDKTFYNEEFEGVEVEYMDETVVIDYENFYKYTKIAMNNFLNKDPQKKDQIKGILENMKNTFSIIN